MSRTSRRTFLTVAGTGAAVAGMAVVAPAAVAAPAKATALPAGATGSVVAHVKDVRAGTVTVMARGREVVVTDHELVARLAHAVSQIRD